MGESPRVAGTRRMAPPVIVGVAGASGSGKTCIASLIEKRLQGVSVVSISSDSYYRGLKEGSDASKHNWDHPDALDLDLLSQHLMDLREGRDVQVPVYNFSTHSRDKVNAVFVSAHDTDVIIVDGIFVLCVEKLRKAFDLTLFTVEDLDVCLVRRLRRDIAERGRSIESVLLQYMMFVRPGYTNFIEPSRSFADILVPRARDNHIAIEMVRVLPLFCLALVSFLTPPLFATFTSLCSTHLLTHCTRAPFTTYCRSPRRSQEELGLHKKKPRG